MNISEMRKLSGLSQAEFANILNIPKGTIQKWEYRGGCSEYVEQLIEYKLRSEGYIAAEREDKEMTKREVIDAMFNLMIEADEKQAELIKSGTARSALDLRAIYKDYNARALEIAEKNGYTNGCKWQLWDEAVKKYERKLNIR